MEAQLAAVFSRYPEIQAVYLFGSHAEGRATSRSDLDLAAILRPHTPPPDKLDLLTDLVRAGFEQVDLVFLDPADIRDIVLWFDVVRHNRVIYAVEDFDRGQLFSKIARMYWDFVPILERQRRRFKERILGGQS
ncbi:nucleotidyltransferase domain-containing protein [Litorilinea aerophila]|uniref:Nucleotidyltransferase domain-containing protein n=1 Tax=Litorilinea aerophila TaxID=1204385 RepID=A0A540V927_9CHLR|nr:nucleotidyltransferase domain-containing protein [Litorilinea aerophila]MCC9078781.1 nucleotidyltransferase domain-containing protein [Litorilinea aerophila]